MKKQTLVVFALAAASAPLAILAACDDTLSAGFDPAPDAGPSTFVAPDAADAEAPTQVMMCPAYDCPAPYATCSGKSGLCNTNLAVDNDNCGACGNSCPKPNGVGSATMACIGGQCQLFCTDSQHADCNGLSDDGCETDTTYDSANCGGCGNACNAGEVCWQGVCGCPPGYAQCGLGCVQLDGDPTNCGACGQKCTVPEADADVDAGFWPCGAGVLPPNVGAACIASACAIDCKSGFADCNTDGCGDGCETNIAEDVNNCGGCGHACDPSQLCMRGRCICGDPLIFCGGACVDPMSDPMNCGECGHQCPGAYDRTDLSQGEPSCVLGRCSYYCPPGRADCNHRIEDGCEIDLTLDPLNCGECGTHCDLDAGQPCAASQCLVKPCNDDGGGVF